MIAIRTPAKMVDYVLILSMVTIVIVLAATWEAHVRKVGCRVIVFVINQHFRFILNGKNSSANDCTGCR